MPVVLAAPVVAGVGGHGVGGACAVALGGPAVAAAASHGVGGSGSVVLQAVRVVGAGNVPRVRLPAAPRPPGTRAIPRETA